MNGRAAHAESQRVLIERLGGLIRAWEANGRTLSDLAARAGLDRETVAFIRGGETEYIRLGTADRLVCALPEGPVLWHTDPVLASLYGSPLAPEGGLPPAWPFPYAPRSDREPRRRSNVPGHDTGGESDVRAA